MIFNLLVVWLATGLWHGAHLNFLLWGLGLFAVLVVEQLWLKKYLDRWPILRHLYMLVLIPVSWAVFSMSDRALGAYFGRLFPLFSRTAAAYRSIFSSTARPTACFSSSACCARRRCRRICTGGSRARGSARSFWPCCSGCACTALSKGMTTRFMYFRF